MLLGPIFQVELVSTSRRGRYFALRVVYGLLLLLVLWTCYEQSSVSMQYSDQPLSTRRASEMAAYFFYGFGWLQMLAILFVGPALAVGTIATERERRTIEYLFVTDLSDREIVLAKAAARLLLLFKLIMVGLPVLFLFRLFGGIPVGSLLALFLLSASSALMVTALSIFVSVWSTRSRDATVRVYLLLVVIVVLPMILGPIGLAFSRSVNFWNQVIEPIVKAILVINPLKALIQALGSRFATGLGMNMGALWWTVFWQTVVSGVALLSAVVAVRKVHLAESSQGSKKKRPNSKIRLPRWKPAIGNNPILWKEMFADTAKTRLGVIGVVAIGVILITIGGLTCYLFWDLVILGRGGSPNNYFEYTSMMTTLIGTGLLIVLTARAAGLVTTEIEGDSWDSLLATPLTGREIMFGKMWGNLYCIRWALVVLAGIWGLGVVIDYQYLWAVLALVATLFVHSWYATNLGLTFSMRSKTSLQAMGGALATLVFCGGGYLFCCCAVMFTSTGPDEIMFAPCIPFHFALPTMAYLDVFGNIAYRNLEDKLVMAYVFGMIIYLIVATVLATVMAGSFDETMGRVTWAETPKSPHHGADGDKQHEKQQTS